MTTHAFPHDVASPRPPVPVITVTLDGKKMRISYPKLFAVAFGLWRNHKYQEAREIFQYLCTIPDRGPRAHILYAHCCAMLEDYATCSRILHEGLPSETYGRASIDLHDAFVMWRCGLPMEVRKGLEKVVQEQPQLPTPCLILSTFLEEMGNAIRPPIFLKQAIDRDFPGGAVGHIARCRLPAARKASQAARVNVSRRHRARTPATHRPH
ncbi:MAG: hypothetical protein U0929_06615 [Planctomycetaceae bacterium]